MPFWTKKTVNNEEYIEMTRKQDEEKRRRFIQEYEKAKKRQEESSNEDGEGPTTKEKLVAGAKRAGQTFKKIYEYEPSQKDKASVRQQFKFVRSEVAELGRMSPRSRERFRRSDDDEITWDQYFGGDNLGAYAESMTPSGLRMDWQGQQTGHRYSSDRYDPYIEFSGGLPTEEVGDTGFVNPLEGFDSYFSFSGVASGKSSRGRKEVDLYSNPLSGYDDYFSQLAGGTGKKKRRR